MTDNTFNYDSFVRNPPNPVNIDDLFLQDSLFSSNSSPPPLSNSFNIFSLNINGLKVHSQNKIEQLNNLLSLKHISFGGVVDTHLHPKQMQFLSKRLSNYIVFSSSLDTSQHVRSSGGVLLFIENSLAPHVHTYTSHSSRLLSPRIASKCIHRLFNFLLSNGYVDFTPVNSSDSLGTFHRADTITRIDYIWSCPLLKSFLLTSIISDACDHSLSDHNPIITYFDSSFLRSSIKLARACQLKRRTRRIFLLDSVSPALWDDFSAHIDAACNVL
ncbi:hypothetical protein RclHR1_06530010 [Rhizophagus clarus]|uniref:Endonuclease/exonuclease/phosphatase domain-containing protein n=1 Tax=Rhizophagus clarus TaxID=94130 RepID=A0A2Z6S933_9GLOM|nr:hypothetical protein RclHR1_06530010 [Rhizophagus clarus]